MEFFYESIESRSIGSPKIFVTRIPREISEDDLLYYFKPFGNIVDIIIMRDSVTQISKGKLSKNTTNKK